MNFLKNDSGIAYAMVYVIMGIFAIGTVFTVNGIMIDEFETLSLELANSEMWADNQNERVIDLIKIWNLVLSLTIGCSLLYGIVTAIRKERRGSIG